MAMPEVLTVDELASYLRLSKSSLYKLLQQGKVPGVKVGKHWRFPKRSVVAWLERGEACRTEDGC